MRVATLAKQKKQVYTQFAPENSFRENSLPEFLKGKIRSRENSLPGKFAAGKIRSRCCIELTRGENSLPLLYLAQQVGKFAPVCLLSHKIEGKLHLLLFVKLDQACLSMCELLKHVQTCISMPNVGFNMPKFFSKQVIARLSFYLLY